MPGTISIKSSTTGTRPQCKVESERRQDGVAKVPKKRRVAQRRSFSLLIVLAVILSVPPKYRNRAIAMHQILTNLENPLQSNFKYALMDQHRIAVTEKPIFFLDGFSVSRSNQLVAAEGMHQNQ